MDDWVYVKLRPYRQTSVTPSFSKLTKRCYSPLWVEECIGQVAYRLKLPESSKIYLVFHVSLLKPHHSPLPDSPATLPPAISDNHPVIKPLSQLNWKWDSVRTFGKRTNCHYRFHICKRVRLHRDLSLLNSFG